MSIIEQFSTNIIQINHLAQHKILFSAFPEKRKKENNFCNERKVNKCPFMEVGLNELKF